MDNWKKLHTKPLPEEGKSQWVKCWKCGAWIPLQEVFDTSPLQCSSQVVKTRRRYDLYSVADVWLFRADKKKREGFTSLCPDASDSSALDVADLACPVGRGVDP